MFELQVMLGIYLNIFFYICIKFATCTDDYSLFGSIKNLDFDKFIRFLNCIFTKWTMVFIVKSLFHNSILAKIQWQITIQYHYFLSSHNAIFYPESKRSSIMHH